MASHISLGRALDAQCRAAVPAESTMISNTAVGRDAYSLDRFDALTHRAGAFRLLSYLTLLTANQVGIILE